MNNKILSTIKKALKNRKKKHQIIMIAKGDSMIPTIKPAQQIVVDTSVKRFKGDGIYAFNYCETDHIKRLVKQGGVIKVIPDNDIYISWGIERHELKHLNITGKIIESRANEQ